MSTEQTTALMGRLHERQRRLNAAHRAVIEAARVQYEAYGAYPGLIAALRECEAAEAAYD